MMLTQEELRELLNYDPDTGLLTWRAGVRYGLIGKRAGNLLKFKRGDPYWMVCVRRKKYLAHRLIWFYVTGEWPPEQIDHIDCDGLNNAWANLRLATNAQNQENTRRRKDNCVGLKGVSPWGNGSRMVGFRAQITAHGKKKYLGTFKTADEAHAAYVAAAKRYFGEFART